MRIFALISIVTIFLFIHLSDLDVYANRITWKEYSMMDSNSKIIFIKCLLDTIEHAVPTLDHTHLYCKSRLDELNEHIYNISDINYIINRIDNYYNYNKVVLVNTSASFLILRALYNIFNIEEKPTMKISEFRNLYPVYNDMSDSELTHAIHKKYYSDMQYEKFENYFIDVKNKKSFNTINLKYGISLDIPSGWEILDQSLYRQLDNMAESITEYDQSNNEILFAMNCYTDKEFPSSTFRISIRNKYPNTTQEDLKYISNEDLFKVKKEIINNNIKLNSRYNKMKTDINSINVSIYKIGNLYSILEQKYIITENYKSKIFLYIIPLKDKRIKIFTSCLYGYEHIFEPILERIIKSFTITN